MYRDGHAVTGALTGACIAWALTLDPGQGLTAIAASAAGATGITSPDVDQWLKGRGVWAHRRGTHYWRWLARAAAAGMVVVLAVGWLLGVSLWWVWLAYTAGWFTHLAGDWAFGRRVHGTDGPGIPIRSPNRGYHGLGWFRSGGWTERVATWLVFAPALAAAVLSWLGVPWAAAVWAGLDAVRVDLGVPWPVIAAMVVGALLAAWTMVTTGLLPGRPGGPATASGRGRRRARWPMRTGPARRGRRR